MGNKSITIQALTTIKRRRFAICGELQQRTTQRLRFARSDALELLAIEVPREPPAERGNPAVDVIVTQHNKKTRLKGTRFLVWNGPVQTIGTTFGSHELECTTAACTWAHYASILTPRELVVLGDSMMRRNKRLRRAEISDFASYLALAEQMTAEAVEVTASKHGMNRVKRPRLFKGYRNCRIALALMREGTDSSQETRTRLVLLSYGLPEPVINHEVKLPNGKSVFLDMAYPELRIAIEYDGNYHRFDGNQVLRDDKRREALEALGWIYVKVTVLDLDDEESEEALAQRVATRMEDVLGVPVPLVPRMTLRQVADGRRLKKIPIWERVPRDTWAARWAKE